MKRRGYILAIAFVVLINAAVLASVAYNRSGTPTSELRLTARELPVIWHSYRPSSDDSGLSLRIRWNRPAGGVESIFDRQKLEALGFHLPVYALDSGRLKSIPAREAYVVLEYRGKAWNTLLERRRKALNAALARAKTDEQRKRLQNGFESFEETTSRLVLVDAGPNPATLRQRYPDRSRYLITQARITAYRTYNDKGGKPTLRASVSTLLPATVSVPHSYRALFLAYRPKITERRLPPYGNALPDYTVTLAYGRRYEPWVVSAGKNNSRLPASPPASKE